MSRTGLYFVFLFHPTTQQVWSFASTMSTKCFLSLKIEWFLRMPSLMRPVSEHAFRSREFLEMGAWPVGVYSCLSYSHLVLLSACHDLSTFSSICTLPCRREFGKGKDDRVTQRKPCSFQSRLWDVLSQLQTSV